MPYYEFGSVTFAPRAEDFQPMPTPGEGLFSLRHIPYSNANVLDLGGQAAWSFGPIDIRIDPDDATDLEAAAAGQFTDHITLAGVDYPLATLVSLTNKRQTPRGEWIFYTAHWIVG